MYWTAIVADCYRPPTNLQEGDVFTSVCLFAGVGLPGPSLLLGVGIPGGRYTEGWIYQGVDMYNPDIGPGIPPLQ